MNTVVNSPQEVLSYKFRYDGVARIVDNVSIDAEHQQLLGFELRRGGKFSNEIKRFTLSKIDNLERIIVVRPNRPVSV